MLNPRRCPRGPIVMVHYHVIFVIGTIYGRCAVGGALAIFNRDLCWRLLVVVTVVQYLSLLIYSLFFSFFLIVLMKICFPPSFFVNG